MLRTRSTGFLFLRLLVLYALLMGLWPLAKGGYTAYYRAFGRLLYSSFGSAGMTIWKPLDSGAAVEDTEVILRNRSVPRLALQMLSSSRYTGYAPTVTLCALVLATPIPWSRRWRAFVWGLVLMHGFIAFRLAMSLLNAFSNDTPVRIVALSAAVKFVVQFLVEIVWTSTFTCSFVIPIFIWIVVSFRRGDWDRLRGPVEEQGAGQAGK